MVSITVSTISQQHYNTGFHSSLFICDTVFHKSMIQTPPLGCTPTLPAIAPCEHIAGNEKFILKGFELQRTYRAPNGRSLVDLTLDLEDGAPIGHEEALRQLFARLLLSPENTAHQAGVRIHPVDSEHCVKDLEVIISKAGNAINYITIPKVKSAREANWVRGLITHYQSKAGHRRPIGLHLLIETSEALGCLPEIAAVPGVVTFDFGLMDFISQLGGGISADCMKTPGQFTNELLRTTKSTIALTALARNIIPSHNVTVDVRNPAQAYSDALRARVDFGFLRMWSIHPSQIEPIIRGMTPSPHEVLEAKEIIRLAAAANWGPIEHNGRLHDRASFRYYWGVLARSGE
jgi:citrate lyase subunit beta/citryl-CoA lyase